MNNGDWIRVVLFSVAWPNNLNLDFYLTSNNKMKLLEISFRNWSNILHGSCVTTFIIRDFAKQSQLRITAHILLYALSVFIKGAQNKMQSHALSFSLIDWRFCRLKLTLLPSRCQLIPCILFRSLVKETGSDDIRCSFGRVCNGIILQCARS